MLALGHRNGELWERRTRRSASGKVTNHNMFSHDGSSTDPVRQAEGLRDLPRYLGSHPAGHLVWPRWYAEKEMRSKMLCSRLHLWHLTALGHICTEFVGSQLWFL